MKIIVCGDSFCSADTGRPGTHFSELLQFNGHQVINLARGGISNTGIAFQMQEAIKFDPDVVIFSTTFPRLTIPTGKQPFKKHLGLKNFCYPYKEDMSSTMDCVGGLEAAIWADVWPAILNPRPTLPKELHMSSEQLDAIKKYLAHLFDNELQEETDKWLVGFWQYRLQELGIKILKLHRDQGPGKPMYDYVRANPTLITQAVYHTDVDTQVTVANNIVEYLKLHLK